VLRLGLLAALEVDSRQLGDALDELRDLVAELFPDVVDVRARVLDDVVEQGGRDRLVVEPELGADLRGTPGMEDEVLAGTALLSLVGLRGEPERPGDQVAVELRVVRRDNRQQLIDELLMTFVNLDDCHTSIVRGAFQPPSSRISSGGDDVPMVNERRPWRY